jgi:hypothetical protein
MVSPPVCDFEIPGREALKLKPAPLYQFLRECVSWLNVGFKSMQLQFCECVPEHEPQSLRHIAFPGEGSPDIIAKVGILKQPSNDLADVENAEDRAIFDSANKERFEIRAARFLEIG